MTAARTPRADAVRNRVRIMEAARELFEQRGSDIAMDDIAAAAGVAVGTLYRHFPTKEDLIDTVVTGFIADVADDAEAAAASVRGEEDPMGVLTAFVRRVVDGVARLHAIKAAATGSMEAQWKEADEARIRLALTAILDAARDDGTLRPDATADDVFLLVSTAPVDQGAEARERWLALVLPGLRAQRAGSGPALLIGREL